MEDRVQALEASTK